MVGREDRREDPIFPHEDALAPDGAVLFRPFPGVVLTTLEQALRLRRDRRLAYAFFATACCGIDMVPSEFAPVDWERRFRLERPAALEEADLLIVAGTLTEKVAPFLVDAYRRMAEPRLVVALGGCAISGGPFYRGYNVIDGVNKIVPVDLYIPGCPPRPETFLSGLERLRSRLAPGRR